MVRPTDLHEHSNNNSKETAELWHSCILLGWLQGANPSADWNAGSNKNRSAAVGLGASVVGSDGAKVCRCAEVFEVGEPKKILTECEWNLKLKLASVAPLLDADIHERVVGTGTADSVRDKVTVFNAGELFEGSRLKNAPQGSVAVGLNAEPIWRVSLPIVMATIPKY